MKNIWPTKKLGEVAEVGAGNSAPQEKKYFLNGTTPFFRTSDVGKVHLSNDLNIAEDLLNEDAIRDLKIKVYPKHTILFPKSGASTFLNHRVMIGIEGTVSSHLATIVARENILQAFLFYFLLRIDAKKLTADQNYPSLRVSDIQNLKIPLPPLKIQKQIVERLDKIAEAQKLNDELIQKADELFQSLLHKELDPTGKNWDVKKLGEICDVRDGTHESPKFYPGGVPLITSKNLIEEDVDFKNINYISLGDHREIDKRSRVDDGDILFGMIGTIGNPVIVKKDREFSIKNVGLIKSVVSSPINYFVYYSLLGNFIQKQVKKFSRGGTQKFVSLGNLRNLKIKVPNRIVQKQIVEKLSAAQDYKKKLLQQKELLRELFDSTLAKAMKGELVK